MAKAEDISKRRKARQKAQKNTPSTQDKAKTWAKEWFDALIWAGLAALLIRQFFFGAFRIPTPSMEKSLLVGDFLIVSKLHYGPRTPMSVAFPFTGIHIPDLTLPWFRIPGFQDIERNDVVVFNYPIEDKVISQKQHYIKRLVGLPGDTLEVDRKKVYINGDENPTPDGLQQMFEVQVNDRLRLSSAKVKDAGGKVLTLIAQNVYLINMTEKLAEEMKSWNGIQSVRPNVYPTSYREPSRSQFVFASGIDGNRDHLPKIVVPFKGQKITLTQDNWHLYYDIIARYEGNTFRRSEGIFTINGKQTATYTIQQDYYFMMGDNRDDSLDSRYWGFVPYDHITGKAFVVYFSWDKEEFLPRFSRILNLIR